MSDYVIKVENLSKAYTIRHQQERYTALRDVMADTAKRWGRRLLRPNEWLAGDAAEKEIFWALKDVSFEVKQGERLGIIGRNGAGKSTLLKVLSRITEPTRGEVRLRGRVASLLEVGTGFHPELTGRENIYLNGAILGMTKAEIVRKFDEIVAFAEVEKFLDTPVKRYSSGMYVRLAFAVAAHLEPEVLLVDEVLAVGDAAFQKKCLQKMGDVASEGRTILFVSHDMSAISVLCSHAILLEHGTIANQGEPDSIIGFYQQGAMVSQIETLEQRADRRGEGGIRFTDIRFLGAHGSDLISAVSGMPLIIRLHYKAERDFTGLDFAIGLRTVTGMPLILTKAAYDSGPYDVAQGTGCIDCTISDLPLAPGSFYVNIAIQQASIEYDWIERAALLDVVSLDYFQNGSIVQKGHSPILVRSCWRLNASVL